MADTDIEGTKRVRDTLDFVLKPVLEGFVEANMKKKHGPRWLHYASRAAGSGPNDSLDAYGLLKTIIDNWNDVFYACFDRKVMHKARNQVSVAFDARNATSHLNLPLSDAEALNYLFAMLQLAEILKAPAATIEKVKSAYTEQRNTGIESGRVDPATPTVNKVLETAAQPQLGLTAPEASTSALKPWIEVALPHPDVISNRFKEAEFAADLFAVDAGLAGEGYATPSAFYGMTFLTEGLKRVLMTAVQRLGGSGGDPVIGLQTAFGGGKTHTMLALFHLVRHLQEGGDPQSLPGIRDILDRAGVATLPKPKIAVFVGSSKGTDVSLNIKDGPRLHTLWGYIAWRIAGEAGLRLVADAEAARTSPGSELMVEVFKLAGPSVILLDELTMFARQLDGDRFEAFLSFIQSLTEAAKMAPGILIVGSLPESKAEAGGERGERALLRLEVVFGRVQSPWLPASGDETYEIIRRRLFQSLDTEGEKAREETVKAFYNLYKSNAVEFPPAVKEARYLELLRLSYPIHPELFDRLSKDWASLAKFQRTRGVLRFMANVVGVLWHAQSRDPMITPARIPVAHERVRASVLYPLDPAFGAVVDKEVDGDGSLPGLMEANPSRRISQARAATRAARAVFICSAPLVGQPNAGVTGQGLRLACAEPGDQLAIFGEALRELTERATYLYEEAGHYWFSTQPTLNRLADDRARALPDHEIDAAIADVLRDDARAASGFHRVFAAPDDPVAIDEAQALSLVILGPEHAHTGRGPEKSPATDAVDDALTRCRSSQRRFRNTLIFVAPDLAQLGTARDVMRKAIAWASISSDDRLQQQMTQAQSADARDKAKTNRDSAQKAVRAAWSHILHPVKTDIPGKPFELEHNQISSRDRPAIPAMVYDKAKADGIALEKLGTERLWLALKPIWPADRPHLPISEIVSWFASYVYLPKLRDRVVLEGAIRDSLAKLDPQFGFAESFDDATGRYHKLIWAKDPPGMNLSTGLIVREAEARRQLEDAEAAVLRPTSGGATSVSPGQPLPLVQSTSPVASAPVGPKKLRRFYGSVEIDMVRPVKSFDAVLNAVIMELQRTSGAKVKLTLEIEATAADGFDEADVSVVRDNARQLKFKPESTGFDD
ncbi:DUF499 domain-containing protein [Rhizobium sp. MC63]|uniref:DUF499 domain-containing protein n=1 Tax=Rhizobium mulingense TaxID=3031128 RepID=A0ACC6MYW4_9HYPH|nr:MULTISPECIES: DUF499 domain-containing protein [unclassified Rhizobium]MDF0697485.1 DUF499 domain-containing protein [Rhizobium sp. MC63]MEA3518333.1 DUF499 domain-containing protein [Rhizobium sp. MJ31]